MIDFHSHIIPGIDDGSRNIEETLNMIKEASKAGFKGIVLTSHYIEDFYETKEEDRRALMKALYRVIEKNNIDMDLYLGNEIYFSGNIVNLIREKKASTINNSRYVLFEFPLNAEPINVEDVIYSLLEHKFVPVLAHPERYPFIQKNPSMINELIDKGVYMQSNYGSILGKYGEKAQIIVTKMLECNLVHFLGSDAHRPNSIYTQMGIAMKKINEIVGQEIFEEISRVNPLKAILNEKIEIAEPLQMKFNLIEKMKLK